MNNPLSKYFRQVKSYIAIPSSKFKHVKGNIEFTNDRNEISIKGMTAVDEVVLKNPDALLNGEAVTQVIKSCVAEVKDPKKLYINDVNVLIAAIKMASNGKDHPITTTCPACQHKNDLNLDLEVLLQNMSMLDEEYVVDLGELKVHVCPFTFESQIKAMSLGFEESKSVRLMQDADAEDSAKIKAISTVIRKMSALNFDMIADSIFAIELPDGTKVTDRKFIGEFVTNIEKDHAKQIEEKVSEINKIGLPQEVGVECQSCKHEWKTQVSFDPTTFFTNS